jgi:hypothetical protein
VKDGFAFGPAASMGRVLEVDPLLAGGVRGAFYQVGYVHTHPTNSTMGAADLATAIRMRNEMGNSGGTHQTAYVVKANGGIDCWSTEFLESTPSDGSSWSPHLERIRSISK